MSNLEQYTHYFSNLNRAPWNIVPGVSKGRAPHKPLLLLALIDLIETGEITSSFIGINNDIQSLNELFTSYWNRIIPAGQRSNVVMPFVHLHNEPFWKINTISGEEFIPDNIESVKQLSRVAVGANIDEHLFQLMQQDDARNALQNALLTSCFSDKAIEQLSTVIIPSKNQTGLGAPPMTDHGSRYWVCGLGEGAKFWDECRTNNILVFGLDELPSLSIYKTKDELKQAIINEGSRGTNPYNDALAGWQFANEIKVGDIIIPKRGTKAYLGYGIVSGPYKYEASRSTYRNVIPVIWKKTGEWLETEVKIIIKTLTDITPYPDYVKRLIELIGIESNGSTNHDLEKSLSELRAIFPEYLKQFVERARLANPELSQIPISAELSQISQRLRVSFKTSFGMGYPTKIPWLACFLPNQSASVDGVYPVVLYRKEQSSVTVNYGVSATAAKSDGHWPRVWPKDVVSGLPRFPDKKYGESYMAESFEGSQVDNLEGITDSFIKVISDFISLQNQSHVTPPKTAAPVKPLRGINQKAGEDFASANLRLQQSMVARYIASLLTKRFVILTGLSGSGKTKLAHAFASWLSKTQDQYRLVAVGADWTSNENVLGFQDALQSTVYRKPVSGALDLILLAEKDPAHPYFLILDEMNLSHVERYFADILSAIESGQEIALHSADERLGSFAGDQLPVPAKIRLPDNLFVVGTVNIDETTYMFSPKVLDRANVIEFRATAEDIASFLDAPGKVDMDTLAGKGAEFGQAFVDAAQLRRSLTDLPEIFNGTAAAADLKQRLTVLFGELAPIGAEFGFRTAFEISNFFYHHAVLTGNGWQFNDALDAQIIQKLMPKLHGSDRKLRPTLTKLKSFCETYQLSLSLTKVDRMLERLAQDGFTSFAEA